MPGRVLHRSAIPAPKFTGTFDGLGHTISHLTINITSGTSNVGLFGYTGIGAALFRDVGLVGGSVNGQYSVGALVGVNGSGSITNSWATGGVTGSNEVGGLVGYNGGTVSDSYATGPVSGTSGTFFVGGLVGYNAGGALITNSYATGSGECC